MYGVSGLILTQYRKTFSSVLGLPNAIQYRPGKYSPHHVINNNYANDRYNCVAPGVEEVLPSPIPPASGNTI